LLIIKCLCQSLTNHCYKEFVSTHNPPSIDLESIVISEDQLTDEEIESPQTSDFESNAALEMEELAITNPQKAIKQLNALIKTYPENAIFYNLLSIAYQNDDKDEEGHNVIEECYAKLPNHIVSKLSYADHLLRLERLAEVPEIFNGKVNLKDLYPDKKVFKRFGCYAFNSIMCRYFSQIGDIAAADAFWNLVDKSEENQSYLINTRIELTQAKYHIVIEQLNKSNAGESANPSLKVIE
jgi:hypothetical protein